MSTRTRSLVTSAAALLVALLLAACGSGGDQSPPLTRVPMPPHSKVVLDVHACNRGANAFCALKLVVAGDGYPTSKAMAATETALLRQLHWRHANADTGLEQAAYSPGDKLRLTYATPKGDLASIELGWIQRKNSVEVALSHTLFANHPALSMLVEQGPG